VALINSNTFKKSMLTEDRQSLV